MKTQLTILSSSVGFASVLAALAGWMNRKQQELIVPSEATCETLLACGSEEQRDDSATQTNETLKEQLESNDVKLKLRNTQRRKLAKAGKKLGRMGLMKYARIVTPDTILYWHRKLVALKYTVKRKINTERQEEMVIIKELCVKLQRRIQAGDMNASKELWPISGIRCPRARSVISSEPLA